MKVRAYDMTIEIDLPDQIPAEDIHSILRKAVEGANKDLGDGIQIVSGDEIKKVDFLNPETGQWEEVRP